MVIHFDSYKELVDTINLIGCCTHEMKEFEEKERW